MKNKKIFIICLTLLLITGVIFITVKSMPSKIQLLNAELYIPIFEESDILEIRQPNQTPFGLSVTTIKLRLNDEAYEKLVSVDNPFLLCRGSLKNISCSKKWTRDEDAGVLCSEYSSSKHHLGQDFPAEQKKLCLEKDKQMAFYYEFDY